MPKINDLGDEIHEENSLDSSVVNASFSSFEDSFHLEDFVNTIQTEQKKKDMSAISSTPSQVKME